MSKIYAEDTTKEDIETSSIDNTEDNLELKSLGFLHRIKAKRQRYLENIKDMSKAERIKYFIYYYKGSVILGLIIAFCLIAIPVTMYLNTRPVAISYAVINQDTLDAPDTTSIEGFCQYFGYGNKYQVKDTTSLSLNLSDAEESQANDSNNSYTSFTTLCYNGHVDIIITDMAGLEYCTYANLTQSLDSAMTQEVYDQFVLQYPNVELVTLKNASNDSIECAINISDTEFAKGFNLSYEDVYLCFPGSKDSSRTKAKEIMEYIYGIKIEK